MYRRDDKHQGQAPRTGTKDRHQGQALRTGTRDRHQQQAPKTDTKDRHQGQTPRTGTQLGTKLSIIPEADVPLDYVYPHPIRLTSLRMSIQPASKALSAGLEFENVMMHKYGVDLLEQD
jgi:hypothetical protein